MIVGRIHSGLVTDFRLAIPISARLPRPFTTPAHHARLPKNADWFSLSMLPQQIGIQTIQLGSGFHVRVLCDAKFLSQKQGVFEIGFVDEAFHPSYLLQLVNRFEQDVALCEVAEIFDITQ